MITNCHALFIAGHLPMLALPLSILLYNSILVLPANPPSAAALLPRAGVGSCNGREKEKRTLIHIRCLLSLVTGTRAGNSP